MKHLPFLKILEFFEGFSGFHFLISFFIAKLQGLEEFFLRFSQGLGISGERGRVWLGGGSGYWGRFSVEDLLRWTGKVGRCVIFGPAAFGVVAYFPALEASSFFHALGAFLGGEFLESYHVDIHGVGVTRSSGGRGVLKTEARVASTPP